MNQFPYLYPHSFSEAQRLGEMDLWKDSYQENIKCKEAIEDAVLRKFDGFFLSPDCTDDVISRFGYKRVCFVLANTIQEKSYDGRFDADNKAWAQNQRVPRDDDHNRRFTVDSHPAVLNGFVDQFCQAYKALNLFEGEHCDTIWQELEGKVLVMKPSTLKESYWSPDNQLWVATGGFGCSPNAAGRAVYATCLGDGEENVRWNREDFFGVLKEGLLPDWAREQLEKFQSGQKIGPVDSGPVQVM